MNAETILVVDDNQPLADFVAMTLLPSLGYQTKTAYSGKEALKIIKDALPDLMLLDLEMPDMDGLEILRTLSKENQSIPTILITAHGSEQVAIEAFRLGVHDYLIKPAEEERLSASISMALTESRLRKEAIRLTSELKEQVAWLNALAITGQNVTSSLKLGQVLRRILEASIELTHADEGFLALLDQSSGQLYLRAIKSIDKKIIKTMRLPVLDALLGEVIRSGKPLRATKETDGAEIKVSTGFLVHSLLYVPLLSKGQALGVISLDNRVNKTPFTEKDEQMLVSLANYASVAIDNANLYHQAETEITERKRVEQALRESEARYARAVQGANDGIWDWDLQDNQIYFSPRWLSMLGYTEGEIGKDPLEWFNRVHPEDLSKLKESITNHVRGFSTHFESEHRIRQKDGAYRWVLSRGLATRGNDNNATRLAGSQSDISIRKAAETKLRRDAFFDRLTDLPNRAYFIDRLKNAISVANQRPDYIYVVFFLDLDQFKNINDRFGHPLGDQLLVEIGKRLRTMVRAVDTVARLGGDEFVLLLEGIQKVEDVEPMAEHILHQLSTPISMAGSDIFVSTSIGIVLSTQGYQYPEDILRDADIAMYAAKAQGKSTFRIFDPAMRVQIMERLTKEADLRQAIQKGQLIINYQPIISLSTRSLVCFEALARWNHPTSGLLLPKQFIPLAQDTGLILSIDRWILEQACSQIQQWQQQYPFDPPLKVSVNMTSGSMAQKDLVSTVRQILEKSGLQAQNLKLEITENTIMQSDDTVELTLKQLKDMGVDIQIDDFGTGYSSLAYLQKIPVSALKIDRFFIQQISQSDAHTEIIRAIVDLSHMLGLQAIAEGVETQKQLEALLSIGCDLGQGYLLSLPLDQEKAASLLEIITANNLTTPPWQTKIPN